MDNILTIAPLKERDRENMIDVLMHPVVKKTYMLPDFTSREDAGKLFERMQTLSQTPGHYIVGIYLNGSLIGFLNDPENENGFIELGWVIHPDHHNRGYATGAVKLAITQLFQQGYREVCAGAFDENPASLRVMEKAGMARLDKTDFIDYRGKTHRCIYYSVKNPR